MKLLDGEVFIDQFAESRLADPQVLALIERIRIAHDPVFDAGGASTRHAVRVEAELNDGSVKTVNVEQRRGSSRFPLSRDEVVRKFSGLAKVVLSDSSVEKAVELIEDLDKLESMAPLADLMRGAKQR